MASSRTDPAIDVLALVQLGLGDRLADQRAGSAVKDRLDAPLAKHALHQLAIAGRADHQVGAFRDRSRDDP